MGARKPGSIYFSLFLTVYVIQLAALSFCLELLFSDWLQHGIVSLTNSLLCVSGSSSKSTEMKQEHKLAPETQSCCCESDLMNLSGFEFFCWRILELQIGKATECSEFIGSCCYNELHLMIFHGIHGIELFCWRVVEDFGTLCWRSY